MDPGAVAWIIDRINWLIARLAQREDQLNETTRAGVGALQTALNETRIYYGTQRESRTRIREREEAISRLWITASGQVRDLDEDLANRCRLKAEYWADPVGWSNEALLNARISIQEVEESLQALLQRFKRKRTR